MITIILRMQLSVNSGGKRGSGGTPRWLDNAYYVDNEGVFGVAIDFTDGPTLFYPRTTERDYYGIVSDGGTYLHHSGMYHHSYEHIDLSGAELALIFQA